MKKVFSFKIIGKREFFNNFNEPSFEYNVQEGNKESDSKRNVNKNLDNEQTTEQKFLPELLSHGQKSINNSHLYSENNFSPFSFLKNQIKHGLIKGSTNKLEFPSPSYIFSNEINKSQDLSKQSFLSGLRIDDKIGLVLTDQEIALRFKGLMTKMIKSAMASFFSKQSVSLPITIFEPKSTLQRICDYFSFAPEFLSQASSETNPIERLKLTITFSIAGFYTSSKQLKPFNPLLGETFEGIFSDKSRIYCEQISHYPTVARFLMKDVKNLYTINGYYEFISVNKNFGKKLSVSQTGPNNVHFSKIKSNIIYNLPKINMLNCDSEINRSSYWKSMMVFVDVENSLKAFIKFGKMANVNCFEGYIIEFVYPEKYKFNIKHEVASAKKYMKDKNPAFVSRITGNWLESISFDDKCYWNINSYIPCEIFATMDSIPSDARFREDLIWLFRSVNTKEEENKQKYIDLAQNWKYLLEKIQRTDRELRKNKK